MTEHSSKRAELIRSRTREAEDEQKESVSKSQFTEELDARLQDGQNKCQSMCIPDQQDASGHGVEEHGEVQYEGYVGKLFQEYFAACDHEQALRNYLLRYRDRLRAKRDALRESVAALSQEVADTRCGIETKIQQFQQEQQNNTAASMSSFSLYSQDAEFKNKEYVLFVVKGARFEDLQVDRDMCVGVSNGDDDVHILSTADRKGEISQRLAGRSYTHYCANKFCQHGTQEQEARLGFVRTILDQQQRDVVSLDKDFKKIKYQKRGDLSAYKSELQTQCVQVVFDKEVISSLREDGPALRDILSSTRDFLLLFSSLQQMIVLYNRGNGEVCVVDIEDAADVTYSGSDCYDVIVCAQYQFDMKLVSQIRIKNLWICNTAEQQLVLDNFALRWPGDLESMQLYNCHCTGLSIPDYKNLRKLVL